MSLFTLVISHLTTSNFLWFMDLTFQVPTKYCSLQHWTLLPSPVTSTTGCCFCFGSIFTFFLELFLHWSPIAYWTPTNLGSSSSTVLSFYLFILFIGFLKARKLKWFAIHSLLQWTTFFVGTLQHDPSILGGPTRHGSWLHWVGQGCGPCDQFG